MKLCQETETPRVTKTTEVKHFQTNLKIYFFHITNNISDKGLYTTVQRCLPIWSYFTHRKKSSDRCIIELCIIEEGMVSLNFTVPDCCVTNTFKETYKLVSRMNFICQAVTTERKKRLSRMENLFNAHNSIFILS